MKSSYGASMEQRSVRGKKLRRRVKIGNYLTESFSRWTPLRPSDSIHTAIPLRSDMLFPCEQIVMWTGLPPGAPCAGGAVAAVHFGLRADCAGLRGDAQVLVAMRNPSSCTNP